MSFVWYHLTLHMKLSYTNHQCASLLIMVALLTQSCFQNFYNAESPRSTTRYDQTLRQAINEKRYFILHSDGAVFSLSGVSVDSARLLNAIVDTVAAEHRWFLENPHRKWYRSKTKNNGVLSEIHLYMSGLHPQPLESISLPVDSIKNVHVMKRAETKTFLSHAWGVVFFSAAALVGAFAAGAFGFPGDI